MTSHRAPDDPVDELRHDRRREKLLLWKGVLAAVVVAVVIVVRQLYLT
ncbi:hypothetical protein ACXR2U_14005 [Jatrophihabitans sp. YIM 134969]